MRAIISIAVVLAAASCRPLPGPEPSNASTEERPAPPIAEAMPDEPADAGPLRLSVDLSELGEAEAAALRSSLELDEVDVGAGSVGLSDDRMRALVQRVLTRLVIDHGLEAFDFYDKESYPRLAYWENIVVQLPDYVQYGVHERYSGYSDMRDEASRALAYLVYRTDRSPKHLRALFERYRDLVFAAVPRERYHAAGWGRFTRGLLASYDHLVAHAKYPKILDQVDRYVREADESEMFSGGRTANSYGIYAGYGLIAPKVQAEFVRDGGGYSPDDESTDVVWFSSFWLRRYREGNMEVVRDILRELEAHYGAGG